MSLGKSGKPKVDDEWTILAAIIINYENDKNQLIALSTGTKCFASENCENQDKIIQDCHAESLLKRAFKRYLISKIKYKQQLNDFKVTLFISVSLFRGILLKNVILDEVTKKVPCSLK